MKHYTSNSVYETEAIAENFGKKLRKGDIVAYIGGMGMGKTSFTRGLVQGLGFSPDVVSSPTFALINVYSNDEYTVYHFDMYRITNPDDLYAIGFYDYLDTESVIVIEWSENIASVLSDNIITVTIAPGKTETERNITIQGDERF